MAEIAGELSLPEWTISALFAAARGQPRRHTYDKDEALSRDQSVRDLRLLKWLGPMEPICHGCPSGISAGSRSDG